MVTNIDPIILRQADDFMKKHLSMIAVISSALLASCVNQNAKITQDIMPTTNACAKLELLKKAYYEDFVNLKEIKVQGRASNMWRAKYQLFGQHCQIFSWGGDQQNYSCRLVAPDEETAKKYYLSAKKVTQQCLGEAWKSEEENRTNDDGMKTSFINDKATANDKVSFSTHLVPSPGLFSTTWTIYYYVGNSTQPKS